MTINDRRSGTRSPEVNTIAKIVIANTNQSARFRGIIFICAYYFEAGAIRVFGPDIVSCKQSLTVLARRGYGVKTTNHASSDPSPVTGKQKVIP